MHIPTLRPVYNFINDDACRLLMMTNRRTTSQAKALRSSDFFTHRPLHQFVEARTELNLYMHAPNGVLFFLCANVACFRTGTSHFWGFDIVKDPTGPCVFLLGHRIDEKTSPSNSKGKNFHPEDESLSDLESCIPYHAWLAALGYLI